MDNNGTRNNNHQTINMNSTIYDILRNFIQPSSNNTDRNLPRPTHIIRPIPPPPASRNIPTLEDDIIHLIRELIRSNTVIMNQYNLTLQEYNRNTREYLDVLRTLLERPSSSPFRTNQTQPSVNHTNQSANPNINSSLYNLFPFLLYPTRPILRTNRAFDDVVVRPTTEQINNASELFVYDGSSNLLNTQCPITLCDFQAGDRIRRIRHCRHSFTEESFQNWFQYHVRCPVCRFDIRDYTSSMNNDNNDDDDNDNNDDDDNDDDNDNNDDNDNDTPFTYSSMFSDSSNNMHTTHTNNLTESYTADTITSLLRAAMSLDTQESNANHISRILHSHSNQTEIPILSFEIPIHYDEYFDSSHNLPP